MEIITGYFKKIFTLDLRALAFMRIGVGFFLLIDLYTRATDLQAHYTNDGVLPLHVLFTHTWNKYHFSLHTISGLWQVQALLFALAAFFAICLLVGYRTRFMTVASWLMLISIQNRNPFILQGGDDLARLLLFWAMFLPWGTVYSLDAERKPALQGYNFCSVATAGYVLLIWAVYFFSAQLKSDPEWTTEYTALYYALSLDMIALPVGKLIYPYPELLKFLTFTTWWLELLVPFLLFIPVYNAVMRLIVIGVLFGFHIGVSLTLFVGLFYIIGIVSVLGLLPKPVLDKITARQHGIAQQLIVWLKRIYKPVTTPFAIEMQLRVPDYVKVYGHKLTQCLLVFFIAYTCWWNLDNSKIANIQMPAAARWPGHLLRLDQCWGMFAPAVFKDDGWLVLEGKTANNLAIDLNKEGQKVTYAKAASVVALFKNDRWRKYTENYILVWNKFMRPYYCHFMLNKWNKTYPKMAVKQLEVVYMKEVTLPDYNVEPVKKEVLCKCSSQ